jgi:hypothetical protein
MLNIDNNFSKIREEFILNNQNFEGNNFLVKSNIWKENNTTHIAYINPTMEKIMYFELNFKSFEASTPTSPMICSKGTHLINVYYFECIEQKMLYTCKNNDGISLFKKNSASIYDVTIGQILSNNCQEFINYDIIFLKYLGQFNVIGNFLCDETTSQIYNFPNHFSISGYNFPTDEPDTSFIFSNFSSKTTTIQKTTIPMTTIKETETTISMTTIKEMETTTPITTIKKIETTIPMTTIKKMETTTPITTIKKTETTLPMTTIKKTETTTPTNFVTSIYSSILYNFCYIGKFCPPLLF